MVNKREPRIIYAGDRDISVWVLKFMISRGVKPIALMVSDKNRATHDSELIGLCSHLGQSEILRGSDFRAEAGKNLIKSLNPDYIICVHFPYIVPKEILEIPKEGVLNLHPAYLPYNRGWHTPTWAIFEGTPYGATLHFMDEGVDTGDIVHQKKIDILPTNTADTLYERVKNLEFDVFKESWESLVCKNYSRKHQTKTATVHKKSDIESIQCIDLKKEIKAEELIKHLRALTTNDIKESAYYCVKGKKYRIQVNIFEDDYSGRQ